PFGGPPQPGRSAQAGAAAAFVLGLQQRQGNSVIVRAAHRWSSRDPRKPQSMKKALGISLALLAVCVAAPTYAQRGKPPPGGGGGGAGGGGGGAPGKPP